MWPERSNLVYLLCIQFDANSFFLPRGPTFSESDLGCRRVEHCSSVVLPLMSSSIQIAFRGPLVANNERRRPRVRYQTQIFM